jgi:hypothetical protein
VIMGFLLLALCSDPAPALHHQTARGCNNLVDMRSAAISRAVQEVSAGAPEQRRRPNCFTDCIGGRRAVGRGAVSQAERRFVRDPSRWTKLMMMAHRDAASAVSTG